MKRIELTDKKFGKLTVLSFDKSKSKAGQTFWKCLCDCGNYVERNSYALRQGLASHCGCSIKYGEDNLLYKGVGDISASWFNNKVIRAAKGYYGSRKIKKVDITIEYIWDLFLKQNRKCIYSGLVLTFPNKRTNLENCNATASLDRIDSNKGYIKGNVQWVHKKVNIMKNVMDDKEFLKLCGLIVNNYGNKK